MSRLPLLLAVVLVLLGGACGAAGEEENQATGIVVDVRGDLQEVDSFTVLVEGERVDFQVAPDGDFAFPLVHLRDHLRSGEPVVVRWEEDGARRVATFVDDA